MTLKAIVHSVSKHMRISELNTRNLNEDYHTISDEKLRATERFPVAELIDKGYSGISNDTC